MPNFVTWPTIYMVQDVYLQALLQPAICVLRTHILHNCHYWPYGGTCHQDGQVPACCNLRKLICKFISVDLPVVKLVARLMSNLFLSFGQVVGCELQC